MNDTLSLTTDEELALHAQAGSQRSFEELISRYRHRLFYFLRPKVGSDLDAEDMVQETFLKAYRCLERYDNKWKFSTWLYTAANRLAISYFRSKKNKPLMQELADVPSGTETDPLEQELLKEQRENLWVLASSFHRQQYQSLWLRYVEEMSVKEIAVVLRKNPVTVRVMLHRARQKLAEKLSKQEVSEKRTGLSTRASSEALMREK